jgi:hypothetical protein
MSKKNGNAPHSNILAGSVANTYGHVKPADREAKEAGERFAKALQPKKDKNKK